MERDEEHDMISRSEAAAPNLRPVHYADGGTYICCSEVARPPKHKICEVTRPPSRGPIHCLSTTRPYPKPRPVPAGLHERDILFRPMRWRCKVPAKVAEKSYEPTLGAPIGLSKSSFSMNFLEAKATDLPMQGFATLLVAFAEYYITPEIEWDEKVLNRILLEGQRLYHDSKSQLSAGEELKESKVKRTFFLCDNSFDIIVNDPFIVGHVVGEEFPVANLHCGLLKIFKKFQFCLLQVGSWYTLLWKNADVYFVFDCFGRRIPDFRSDRKRGIAMLICLRNLDNVSHLLLNLSGIQPDALFTLRHLQLKSLVPCGGQPTPEIVDRSNQFEIMSPDYALLRSSVHIGSNCFKEIRHRQSLPVAISALINAKIDATPTWDTAVLDKILKLGAHFYKQWTQCDVGLDLGIQDVPNKFTFGQFMVQIAVNPIAECGLWQCTPNFRGSEMTLALKRAFERGSNILIQLQGRSYAIWRKGPFYYILDPYAHQCLLGKKKIVTGTLRMCGSLERMCCVFTQVLLELFEESKFLIHLVKIIKLKEIDKIKEDRRRAQVPCMCLATPQTDTAAEVVSLNDSVIGVDGYICEADAPMVESDSADLDSPGLSQTRMEDYTDLRRDFMDESESEPETEEEEEPLDLESHSVKTSKRSDESDDDAAQFKKGLAEKSKKSAGGGKDKNSKKEKAGGDASDKKGDKNRGKKRSHENDEDGEKSDSEAKKKKGKDEEGGDKPDKKRKAGEDGNEENPEKKKKKSEEESDTEAKKKAKEGKDKSKKDEKSQEDSKKDEKKKDEKSKEEKKKDEKKKDEPIKDDKKEDKKKDQKKTSPVDQDAPPDEDKSKSDGQSERKASDSDTTAKPAPRRQRRQRRKEQDGDESSSDEVPRCGIPVGCKPNCYPGFTEDPQDLAVVGSESGSYESLCCLLKSAFRCADRVLTMTPWGNYVAFYCNRTYFIFDGCTCNLRSIRHMDLSVGTAGLLCFTDMHSLITYIENGKEAPRPTTSSKRSTVEQICSEYCGQ